MCQGALSLSFICGKGLRLLFFLNFNVFFISTPILVTALKLSARVDLLRLSVLNQLCRMPRSDRAETLALSFANNLF